VLFKFIYLFTRLAVLCRVDIDSLDAVVAQDPSLFDISHIRDELLIKESGKVVFVIGLMENLREENHRVLVFSASRRMLDIIQKVMKSKVRFPTRPIERGE